jgi:ribonuclease HIII
MDAIVYFSLSDLQRSKAIAESLEGDKFQIKPVGKIYNSRAMQMFVYGYKTVFNRPVKFEIDHVDFSRYERIILISPVWAGRLSQYMKSYLETKPFTSKEVVIIGSCEGGPGDYFSSFRPLLGENKVVEEIMYIKGEKQ